VADHVVRPTQTLFMQGRYIIDGLLTLHETIHELHHKKLNGVILKIDFENPMIKSGGHFFNNSQNERFSDEWCTLINKFVF
jgi:hypothetical protein